MVRKQLVLETLRGWKTGGPSCDFQAQTQPPAAPQHWRSLYHNTLTTIGRCVHTVGTSGATISLSVTARDLEQLQAVTLTVFYCCARRRRRFRLCFLTVQLHRASFYQPLADWIYTPYSAAGLKPNKTSAVCVCVGSVEDKGQFLRVKTRRVVAAASSCLQGRVQWFQAGNAGCLRLCWPRPSAALGTVYFDKKINRL